MGSKIALKNAQDQEFSINHLDNAGAIAINSNDISKKSEIETTIAPFNKGFKNYIINGNFDIWQRGVGPFTNFVYGADRWMCYNNVATINSSSTSTNGIQKRIAHIQNTVAGASFIAQPIELPLAGFGHPFTTGKQFTVSVRYSSLTKIRPKLIFRDGAIGANEVNLDSTMTSPTYKGGSGVDETVSWTFTVNGAAAATNTCLVLSFESESVASNLYMYQVQLEEGSVATPFENRPIGLELSLCQRYYEVADSAFQGYSGVAGELWGYRQNLKVAKRVMPTLLTKSYTQTNCGVNAPANGLYDTFIFTASAIAIGAFNGTLQITASAEL